MQKSAFCGTAAASHLTRGCFYGCPNRERKLMPVFKRPAPFYTQQMGSRRMVKWAVTLTMADFCFWGKGLLTDRRKASQGQWQEMFSRYTQRPSELPTGAVFLILRDWESITATGKVQSIPWHLKRSNSQTVEQGSRWSWLRGSQLSMCPQPQDHRDSDSSSARICLIPPISDRYVHESATILRQNHVSRHAPAAWWRGKQGIQRPRVLQPLEYNSI